MHQQNTRLIHQFNEPIQLIANHSIFSNIKNAFSRAREEQITSPSDYHNKSINTRASVAMSTIGLTKHGPNIKLSLVYTSKRIKGASTSHKTFFTPHRRD